jgi:hypothetical protein
MDLNSSKLFSTNWSCSIYCRKTSIGLSQAASVQKQPCKLMRPDAAVAACLCPPRPRIATPPAAALPFGGEWEVYFVDNGEKIASGRRLISSARLWLPALAAAPAPLGCDGGAGPHRGGIPMSCLRVGSRLPLADRAPVRICLRGCCFWLASFAPWTLFRHGKLETAHVVPFFFRQTHVGVVPFDRWFCASVFRKIPDFEFCLVSAHGFTFFPDKDIPDFAFSSWISTKNRFVLVHTSINVAFNIGEMKIFNSHCTFSNWIQDS